MSPAAVRWRELAAASLAEQGSVPIAPAPGHVHLWLFSLDHPPWPSAELCDALDVEERARALRFHFPHHRSRYAHGRGALRLLLGWALGIHPAALRFELGTEGKPKLSAARPTLDFNLSHSDGWALVGLSDGAAIGVDIEVPRAVPELREIAQRNFAPAEQRELLALPEDRQPDAFLAGWTRKEAFVKALGGGLSIPLDDFEVTLDPDGPASLVSCRDPHHPAAAFTLWAARAPQGGWAAVAVRQAAAKVQPFLLG